MADLISPAAERCVIGSMLMDPAVCAAALGEVREEDFALDQNRRLFEAARALFREGAPVDPITVLGKLGLDASAPDRDYLAYVLDHTPTTASWREYARIMHEQAVLRTVQGCAMEIAGALTLEAARAPAAALASALTDAQRTKPRAMVDLLLDFARRKDPAREKKQFVELGLQPIDSRLFLEPGDVLMIGGLPSDGKTAFALQIALHMAARYKTAFFSLETSTEKLADRMVANAVQVDFDRVKRQALTDLDWVAFAEKSGELERRKLWLFSGSSMSVDQIAGLSRAYGFESVVIDYVQLIRTERVRGATRAELLAEVSQQLHTFAQTSGTLVVELAQLKTPDPHEARRNPNMFDLGESSQFGKDADAILLLSRPGKDDRVSDEDEASAKLSYDRHRLLKIAKNKEGEGGRCKLYFDGKHQSFYVLGTEPGARRPSDRQKKAVGNPGQVALEDLSGKPQAEEDMPF